MPQLDVCFNMDFQNFFVYLFLLSYGWWYIQSNKFVFSKQVEKMLKLKLYYKNLI